MCVCQSNLVNMEMNQIASLSYEIMSLLVYPHSKRKGSLFLFGFGLFHISLYLTFLYFSMGPLLFFPTWDACLCSVDSLSAVSV